MNAPHLMEKMGAKPMCDDYTAKLEPIRKPMSSQCLRTQMKQRLKIKRTKACKNDITPITCDCVLCKSSQYTPRRAGLRFEHNGGEPLQYAVLGTNSGVAQLKEVQTGRKVTRNEASLKIMPNVQEANDSLNRTVDDTTSRCYSTAAFDSSH